MGDRSQGPDPSPSADLSPSRHPSRRPSRRPFWRRRRFVVLAIVVAVLAVPGWSLGHTLAASSSDPLSIRFVEWARDHRLGGVVSFAERTWYSHHQPPKGGTPKGGIPSAPTIGATSGARSTQPSPVAVSAVAPPRASSAPKNVVPLVADPLPGEGVWQPTGRLIGGRPVLFVTYLRPDAVHTSLLAGIAHLDMSHATATLHAGTEIPGGGPWLHGPQIAPADHPYVVAAFNSAFRLDNSRGGYFAEGRTVRALTPGRASLVIHADGRVDVGMWGRDDTMSPQVTTVRQNLDLIVDNGALVPNLANANSGLWGGTVGNKIYVWRSGVGVDAHGNLIYVAGPGLNVETLAELLRRAGSVRAMELDINTWWISFTTFTPGPGGVLQPANLLGSMVRSPGRYLQQGTRDFVEIDARH